VACVEVRPAELAITLTAPVDAPRHILKGEKPADLPVQQCDESDDRTERSVSVGKKWKVLAGYNGRHNDRDRYAAAEPRIPSDAVFRFREAFLPRQC
jgi:hypothetical protein